MVRTLALLAALAASTSTSSQSAGDADADAIAHDLVPAVRITNRSAPPLALADEMRRLGVPAVSVAVVRGGKLAWAHAWGVRDSHGAPVDTHTLFQAASISKTFTALAAVRLADAGKLSLDTPVQAQLKTWKLPPGASTAAHPVTLRELLSHTAGTSVHGFAGYAAGAALPTLVQVLEGAPPANSGAVHVVDTPGRAFSYSGGGYLIAQQLMLDATGQTFPAIMQAYVLSPLGMSGSTFEQPLDRAQHKNIADPADENGAFIPGGPHVYPEMSAAGLWTTPTDLTRWMIAAQQAYAGKAAPDLSTADAHQILAPVLDQYGLGVQVNGSGAAASFSHNGGNAGYRTLYFAYLSGDGAAVMTSGENGQLIIDDIMRSLSVLYHWPDYKAVERTQADVPLEKQKQYAGKFDAKDAFPFEITVQGHLVLSALGSSYPLLPGAPNEFFSTLGALQVFFDSPASGCLQFGSQKVPFTRVRP